MLPYGIAIECTTPTSTDVNPTVCFWIAGDVEQQAPLVLIIVDP